MTAVLVVSCFITGFIFCALIGAIITYRKRANERQPLTSKNIHQWVENLRKNGVEVVEEIPEIRIGES